MGRRVRLGKGVIVSDCPLTGQLAVGGNVILVLVTASPVMVLFPPRLDRYPPKLSSSPAVLISTGVEISVQNTTWPAWPDDTRSYSCILLKLKGFTALFPLVPSHAAAR